MTPEQIAKHFRDRGHEVTPDEIRQDIASIANKFRAIIPGLPNDDDELLKIVIDNLRFYENDY